MSQRVWVEGMMQWRRQKASGSWVEDNPPLPKWARQSSGFVSAARFVRMWSAADSLSALKQELFWLSLEDIESQAMLLSDWLVERGYAPLPPKLMWSTAPLSKTELGELVAEGLVVLEEAEDSVEDFAEDASSEADEDVEEEVSSEADEDAEEDSVEDTSSEEDADDAADLTPAPARPDEDPNRDYVPFALQHPGSGGVGIGVQKVKKS